MHSNSDATKDQIPYGAEGEKENIKREIAHWLVVLVLPLFELRGTGVDLTLMDCIRRFPNFDSRNFERQMAAYNVPCPDYETLIDKGWLNALR